MLKVICCCLAVDISLVDEQALEGCSGCVKEWMGKKWETGCRLKRFFATRQDLVCLSISRHVSILQWPSCVHVVTVFALDDLTARLGTT